MYLDSASDRICGRPAILRWDFSLLGSGVAGNVVFSVGLFLYKWKTSKWTTR